MAEMYPEAQGMRTDVFMRNLKQQDLKDNNIAYTENGAQMYGTTGKALLDLNFTVSALRNASDEQIIEKYLLASDEDRNLALKWLFYARDIREGLGERQLFRIIFKYLATHTDPFCISRLLEFVPQLGRWDDLLDLFNTPLEQFVLAGISRTFREDMVRMQNDRPVTLLAKWMPSVNTTSPESRHQAVKIARYMGMSIPHYRKSLSKLRKHMDVIEVKMSDGKWDEIDYSKVPGRANMLYADAFLRHDPERRREFLEQVLNGSAKVHADTVYPHEIVHKICDDQYMDTDEIMSIRAMWESLPAPDQGIGRTVVVHDGSGSMMQCTSPGKSGVSCLDVATGLAIYFSQYLSGPFKNTFITFSRRPKLIDLTSCDNIFAKVAKVRQFKEVANTNVEAVFELILRTAVDGHISQLDMPDNILILSDMQFDACAEGSMGGRLTSNLFESIAATYNNYGYKIPRVCFWNISNRFGAIPMHTNDLGVALMSGYSINNVKLIMSGKLDPYEALLDVLNAERYSEIHYDLA